MSFNTNYQNVEAYYKELEQNKDELKKTMFSKQFPNLSFDDLQIHNDLTDDGCTHYLHKPTNGIYSWNFCEDLWIFCKDKW